jgi:hypothetical protein
MLPLNEFRFRVEVDDAIREDVDAENRVPFAVVLLTALLMGLLLGGAGIFCAIGSAARSWSVLRFWGGSGRPMCLRLTTPSGGPIAPNRAFARASVISLRPLSLDCGEVMLILEGGRIPEDLGNWFSGASMVMIRNTK